MSRFLLGFSVIMLTFGSVLAFMNTRADETTMTTVDPVTQQTTTTQVNPMTDQTTTTTVNPVNNQTTTTIVDPNAAQSTSTTVNPVTNQTTVTQTNTDTGASTTTITTPAPAPQEVVSVPEGYSNCFMVAAGWSNQVWVPEHKVCQYVSSGSNTYQGAAWVDGYWHCNKYDMNAAACTNWDWVKGHWVNTFSVY